MKRNLPLLLFLLLLLVLAAVLLSEPMAYARAGSGGTEARWKACP